MSSSSSLVIDLSPSGNPLVDHLKRSIIHDLEQLKWQGSQKGSVCAFSPQASYDKATVREAMAARRNGILEKNRQWIERHMGLLRENLATGREAFSSRFKTFIEVCESQKQHDLFRMCRYYWSSPYSDYVGLRIRLLVRDSSVPGNPIVCIAALGSPIIHIPERDNWLGWDKHARTDRLVLCMDAFVLGAMPPYNQLLGGKLIAYLLASNEVREIYRKKYTNCLSVIRNLESADLVCIFTTSLYGRSSQYNRLKYAGKYLYQKIGNTRGYGSFHLSEGTFNAMQELMRQKGMDIENEFGAGPSWRMRVIRSACDNIGVDSSSLLCHSFKRSIYAMPLAENFRDVLLGKSDQPEYYSYSCQELVNYWKARWLEKRKIFLEQSGRKKEILAMTPADFNIL